MKVCTEYSNVCLHKVTAELSIKPTILAKHVKLLHY